jgi:hypothetical protein
MMSSETLHHEVLVRTDVSRKHSTSFIRVTKIGELFGRNVRRLLVAASVVLKRMVSSGLLRRVTLVRTEGTWYFFAAYVGC